MITSAPLGAPGIYRAAPTPSASLLVERLDVCAFVGVAPRGPAWLPRPGEVPTADRPLDAARAARMHRSVALPVESWEEYQRIYGGFEGPGMLPYAVRAFFEEGGRRAYVVRVVARWSDTRRSREATGSVPGLRADGVAPVTVHARNEGAWGNALRASTTFSTREVAFVRADAQGLVLPSDTVVSPGTALRLFDADGSPTLRFVTDLRDEREVGNGAAVLRATLDRPLVDPMRSVEVVELTLTVYDGARREVCAAVALGAQHARSLAVVLRDESELLWPDASWVDRDLVPDDPALLAASMSEAFAGGVDGYTELAHEDFFDDATPAGEGEHRDGIHAAADVYEVASLAVPDLYDPRAQSDDPSPSPYGPGTFGPCVDGARSPRRARVDLDGLRLDPTILDELSRIGELQARVVAFAESSANLVALLDVPPGLRARQVSAWRARFRSSYAAAYHPWLKVRGEGDRADGLALVPPSAIAAGIIARKELRDGLPAGPANEACSAVVDVAERVPPELHGALHQLGVNVFARSVGSVWLTGARTLSHDPSYRQLTVRRLIVMLRRVLTAQTCWIAFEPHTPGLRAEVEHALRALLRRLYRAGAFRGATESEAFFVRCDESINPRYAVDAGQLVAEIGVAPAEPVEFIVLRLRRSADGTLQVEG